MTPTRMRECLETLQLSQRGFAAFINRDEGTVRFWARKPGMIPQDVADWLQGYAEYLEKHPPPARPERIKRE